MQKHWANKSRCIVFDKLDTIQLEFLKEGLVVFNMQRNPVETMATTLKRIQLSFARGPKKRKSNEPEKALPEISLNFRDNQSLQDSWTVRQAFYQLESLKVGDHPFLVLLNPRYVDALKVSSLLIPGIQVVPLLDLRRPNPEAENQENQETEEPKKSEVEESEAENDKNTNGEPDYVFEWSWVKSLEEEVLQTSQDGRLDIPEDWVGRSLICRYLPTDPVNLPLGSFFTPKYTVQPATQPEFFENRLTKFKEAAGDALTVGTFNILAPAYAQTSLATKSMFAHCEEAHLAEDYRRPLIIREIQQADLDVLFLQELSEHWFDTWVKPLFGKKYHLFRAGKFGTKDSDGSRDGLGFMFRKDKFDIVHVKTVHLAEYIRESHYMDHLDPLIKEIHELTILDNLKTVAHFAVVREKKTGYTAHFVNTHLFYHPEASHLRVLQIYAIIQNLECPRYSADAIFLGGDLNSTPETGVIRFLSKGFLEADDPDWLTSQSFRWKNEAADLSQQLDGPKGFRIKHNRMFARVKFNEVTTRTDNFEGELDHLYFISLYFNLKTTLDLKTDLKFPNATYGSDHLLTAAAFDYKPPKDEDA